jgi:hypothetical protein
MGGPVRNAFNLGFLVRNSMNERGKRVIQTNMKGLIDCTSFPFQQQIDVETDT